MSFSENKITEKVLTDQINATIPQGKLFDLQSIENKRVEIGFTAQEVSSDRGLLLIKDIEDRIGIVKAISNCMVDDRHQSYVQHSFEESTLQEERLLKSKGLASVTMKTRRERFIKIAAHVKELKTKIKVELPISCPYVNVVEDCFLKKT